VVVNKIDAVQKKKKVALCSHSSLLNPEEHFEIVAVDLLSFINFVWYAFLKEQQLILNILNVHI
jgi:hypothetical protein